MSIIRCLTGGAGEDSAVGTLVRGQKTQGDNLEQHSCHRDVLACR
eukprot:CAMPEP_0113681804 /NCGR_PEP_ID=MMETSP0038_2-20120614/12235_1 /TAXON_ID=2898 /ORGANISM="Cryptomonas paramecium" /LENGTH=44 /DNA_ID=CAMNT_0000600651 /DNA_START=583 /DNA_END=713 /DNA_ORIENTATION=+ /assembly_acc=CAM_ASM_000170